MLLGPRFGTSMAMSTLMCVYIVMSFGLTHTNVDLNSVYPHIVLSTSESALNTRETAS
jgi:hypothetical protein